MTYVVSLAGYQPGPRFPPVLDPWTAAQIEEGPAQAGPWTLIDTIALSPLDADPQLPAVRSFTTENGTLETGGWYRVIFVDASGDRQPTEPVARNPPVSSVLLVGVLKAEYLDITGIKHDAFLTRMLASTYSFALSYTGRSALDALPADLEDAMYTHAARNFRERNAMYADQVVLSEDGGVVNYFRSLPPRVKATYEMHRVSKRKTLTSVPLVRGLS